jgi:hypothetical protein
MILRFIYSRNRTCQLAIAAAADDDDHLSSAGRRFKCTQTVCCAIGLYKTFFLEFI